MQYDVIHISEEFSHNDLTSASNLLKPGKTLGPDRICSEFLFYRGKHYKVGFANSYPATCTTSRYPETEDELKWLQLLRPTRPWMTLELSLHLTSIFLVNFFPELCEVWIFRLFLRSWL